MEDLMDILYGMDLDSAAVSFLSWAMGIVLTVAAVASLLSLALYIMEAVGVYTIAKRRGIRHAWLAWIPLAKYWVQGSLSDQYKQTVKGKRSHNRTILLVIALAGWAVSLAATSIAASGLVRMLMSIAQNDMEALAYAGTLTSGGSRLLSLLSSVLSIALLVFRHITLYDIYCASCPKYSVTYLILGIFFGFTIPFFLFFNRRKDEGMRIPRPTPPAEDEYQY